MDTVVVKMEGMAEKMYRGKMRYTMNAKMANAMAKGRRYMAAQ